MEELIRKLWERSIKPRLLNNGLAHNLKVMVGVSGGVDSAFTAYLLRSMGFKVTAVFMRNWDIDEGGDECSVLDDWLEAQRVCDHLGIKLQQVNFSRQYWDKVFSHFLAEYKAGRTPNPDVLCNNEIKFKAFLDYAMEQGSDFIATGHYARLSRAQDGRINLLQALDKDKDQSYFIHALTQNQLKKSLMPLGEISKPMVREAARMVGLPNHAKRDSVGICFVGKRNLREFLGRFLATQPGIIVDQKGVKRGEHEGLIYYTIGQRKGLKIGGQADTAEDAWFVVDKDLKNNRLIVVSGEDHPLLYSQALICEDITWNAEVPKLPWTAQAKIRYRQSLQECELTKVDGVYKVNFAQAQKAISPGQYIVFYKQQCCWGGAVIKRSGY